MRLGNCWEDKRLFNRVFMKLENILSGMLGKSRKSKERVEISEAEKQALIGKIKQTDLFKDLPAVSLENIFSNMETVQVDEGDVIIKEGDEGDYYYLLVSGKAKVMRRPSEGGEPKVVATLDEPKAFGEEALISNAKRNATIVMTTDGIVMRLSKEAFSDYVKEPLLEWFSPVQAQEQIAKNARWLDVRDASEAKQSHLHNSLTIPIDEIRQRAGELDEKTLYICYCENGRQSSSAAFVLRQMGCNTAVLRGGLQSLKRAGLA